MIYLQQCTFARGCVATWLCKYLSLGIKKKKKKNIKRHLEVPYSFFFLNSTTASYRLSIINLMLYLGP